MRRAAGGDLEAAALLLDGHAARLAIDLGFEQRRSDPPVGGDADIGITDGDFETATVARHGDRDLFAGQFDNPVLAVFGTIARQLPVDELGAFGFDRLHDAGGSGDGEARFGIDRRAVEAIGIFFGNEAGGDIVSGLKARVCHDRRQEIDIVADAADEIAVERIGLGGDRLSPCRGIGDQLGDHRIIEHADFGTFGDAGIDADQ